MKKVFEGTKIKQCPSEDCDFVYVHQTDCGWEFMSTQITEITPKGYVRYSKRNKFTFLWES